jgi:hypothetical protein
MDMGYIKLICSKVGVGQAEGRLSPCRGVLRAHAMRPCIASIEFSSLLIAPGQAPPSVSLVFLVS